MDDDLPPPAAPPATPAHGHNTRSSSKEAAMTVPPETSMTRDVAATDLELQALALDARAATAAATQKAEADKYYKSYGARQACMSTSTDGSLSTLDTLNENAAAILVDDVTGNLKPAATPPTAPSIASDIAAREEDRRERMRDMQALTNLLQSLQKRLDTMCDTRLPVIDRKLENPMHPLPKLMIGVT